MNNKQNGHGNPTLDRDGLMDTGSKKIDPTTMTNKT